MLPLVAIPIVTPLLALLASTHLLYAAPLVVAVSLVYAGTRHEHTGPILVHAIRFAVSIVVFMTVVLLILALMAWVV